MKEKTINCPFLDSRTKWLPCQKERCSLMYAQGMSIADIHRFFNKQISRRIIEFHLFPERRAKSRLGTKVVYNSEKNKLDKAKHREKLKSIFNNE